MAEEPKKSIKEQIQDKLNKGQSIGAADIADFRPVEKKAEPKEDEEVKLEPSSKDKILEAAEDNQPFQGLALEGNQAEAFAGYKLGLMDMDEAEISVLDKEEFMDCLVDDRRFTRYFDMLGGRITGKFRSRTTEESMAILAELARRQRNSGVIVSMEHSAFLRHACLAFQLIEYQGAEYRIPAGPLRAQYDAEKDELTPPAWLKLVDRYANMDEGLEQALYSKLREFERVYWTLVKHANNQDFWNPEDSSIG